MGSCSVVAVLLGAALAASPAAAQSESAQGAKRVLERSCFGCHGRPPNVPVAGVNVFDVPALIAAGLVTPGSAEFSLLYLYLSEGDMPPQGQTFPDGTPPPRPTPDEAAVVKAWITEGALDFNDVQSDERIGPTYLQVLQAIRDDLRAQPADARGRFRYVVLSHWLDEPFAPADVQALRSGTAKAMNSLSAADAIALPPAVDGQASVFRIDLPAYRWTAGTWNRLERAYPFARQPAPASDASALIEEISRLSGTRLPFLRADWLVANALRPPLYYDVLYADILGLPSPRGATAALEASLGIDRLHDVANGRMSRAGFSSSGVSVNNRIIERHEIAAYPGAYWLSYDFSSNSSDPTIRQNIYANPIGPRDAFPGATDTFNHAGGEVIFALPNGLHAYLLVTSADARLDKAPTNIVTDPARPDGAVENGVSCFRCHDQGIILKQDTVREYVDANADLFAADINVIRELYAGRESNSALQRQDLEAYLETEAQLGISVREAEPVTFTVHAFEADLDLRRLAHELYLTPTELRTRIRARPDLRQLIGTLLVADGRIKRNFLIENYDRIVQAAFATTN
jgi:hypothetical protein